MAKKCPLSYTFDFVLFDGKAGKPAIQTIHQPSTRITTAAEQSKRRAPPIHPEQWKETIA